MKVITDEERKKTYSAMCLIRYLYKKGMIPDKQYNAAVQSVRDVIDVSGFLMENAVDKSL